MDDDFDVDTDILDKKSSPLTLKPSLSLTKPPSIFSVSSILADKKTKKRSIQGCPFAVTLIIMTISLQ